MTSSDDAPLGDLPPDVFNRYGHQLVDWITRYLEHPERYPVLARVEPGDVRRSLPEQPPARGESLDDILRDVEAVLLPGVTHWNHPGFFAYFAITASAPGILGELLMSALNVNAMLWKTSPAATELEQVALDWLRQMLGLEPGWFGIISDTASISTLLALAAARERAGARDLAIRTRGLAGRDDLPRLRVYASEHAHSSVDKAAITLGIGQENVVHVAADDAYRLRADRLAAAVRDDRARGWLPVAAVATVGTTSTTSVDPVREIAAVCRREGVWLHVDGAYGGIAAVVPELRPALDGVELADSLVVNPHKWLFTPIDCSALYVRDAAALERAFSLVPEYLRTDVGTGDSGLGTGQPASGASPRAERSSQSPVPSPQSPLNYMDYGVQLGRRFRALKLWMVIRAFGTEGLAERIRAHCAMAREFAAWVEAAPDWELLAPVPFSTVCFRHAPAGADERELERRNAAILEAVNASGEVFLSHTRLRDRLTLRLAIGNLRTERRHVRRAWELLTRMSAPGVPPGA